MDYDGENMEQNPGWRDEIFKRCAMKIEKDKIRNSDIRGELEVESLQKQIRRSYMR